MSRSFKVTVDVDELFELSYTKQVEHYDQREGKYYSTESKTQTFLTEQAARDFIRKERTITPVELVRVTRLPLTLPTQKPAQSRYLKDGPGPR